MSHTAAETLTIRIPMALRKHGRRRAIILPDGAPAQYPRNDNAMIKTLARAFRWKRMLDSGAFATIADLARTEKIDPSYLSRVLRLINLAPDIIEAILDGRLQGEVMTTVLLGTIPWDWAQQRVVLPGCLLRIGETSDGGAPL